MDPQFAQLTAQNAKDNQAAIAARVAGDTASETARYGTLTSGDTAAIMARYGMLLTAAQGNAGGGPAVNPLKTPVAA